MQVPSKLEDIGAKYQEIVRWRNAGGALEPWMLDQVTVAEMLIPLQEEGDEMPLYTCRHLDTSTGLCKNYENRPELCRDFPTYDYGGKCQFCGYQESALVGIGK